MEEGSNPLKRAYDGFPEDTQMPGSIMCEEDYDSNMDDSGANPDSESEELDLGEYFDSFEVPLEDRVKLCQGYMAFCKSKLTFAKKR